jgi:hypothetical protein
MADMKGIHGRPPTGIDPLDELLGGLGVGDDVVWQAASPADIEPFVEAFLAAAHGATPLTYLSFRLPPASVLARFGQMWDRTRFLLLDGWTGGQHDGPDPGDGHRRPAPADPDAPPHGARRHGTGQPRAVRDRGRARPRRPLRARRPDQHAAAVGAEAALALLLRCCPRLYQQRTVAYWLLERDAHPAAFRSRLADITQVVVDLDATPTQPTEQTCKWLRPTGTLQA